MENKRVINISYMQVAGFKGMGWNREQMADWFGVTPQEMYSAMVDLGFYKKRNTEDNSDYVINLVFDAPVRQQVEEVVEEVNNSPEYSVMEETGPFVEASI